MQVYKSFFKIIKDNYKEMMIYIFIFLLFAVILSSTMADKNSLNFTETKSDIAFINNDSDSKIVNGLKNYLSEKANIVELEDDTEKLQDALFYRQVEYIVKVPAGFTKSLLNENNIRLEKISVPDSASSIHMDSIINKYLNTAILYKNNSKNISEEKIVQNTINDLNNETEVTVAGSTKKTTQSDLPVFCYNYMAYSLFAVLILGICAVMMVFNKTDLKRRNLCSPVKLKSINLQLILGNLSFALFVWLIMVVTSLIIYSDYMFSAYGLLLILNSLIFTIAALSLSFLLSSIVKNRGAMSAAANVVALGSSFISGVFVPQELLAKQVLNIASFTPTYWYVRANNLVADIVDFNVKTLTPVFNSMFIMLVFALAMLTLSLVISKHKRTSEN